MEEPSCLSPLLLRRGSLRSRLPEGEWSCREGSGHARESKHHHHCFSPSLPPSLADAAWGPGRVLESVDQRLCRCLQMTPLGKAAACLPPVSLGSASSSPGGLVPSSASLGGTGPKAGSSRPSGFHPSGYVVPAPLPSVLSFGSPGGETSLQLPPGPSRRTRRPGFRVGTEWQERLQGFVLLFVASQGHFIFHR